MTFGDPTAIVAKQYTNYAYPNPVPDMREAIAKGYWEYSSPRLFWPLLWPEGRSLNGLKVLIAGCGTNQAAYNAIAMPLAEITAIDLSLSSLQHSQFLKEKHGLNNLKLLQMNLLEVGLLEKKFDLIICTGVLHHLPDPDAGLRALKGVLAPDGMMTLMVYGRYLRLGVYMLQQAFKLMGCHEQKQEDVELVKAVLSSLDSTHVVKRYLESADDLEFDSGIVDTFLHSQDRAYSVPELFGFAHRSGLEFWDWLDRLDYSHTAAIPRGHPVLQRIDKLNPVAQWTVTELLTQTRGTHRFLLCHPEHAKKTRRINFQEDDWLDWIPSIRFPMQVTQMANPATGSPAIIKRNFHEITLSDSGRDLLGTVNGNIKICEIMNQVRQRHQNLSLEDVRLFFAQMYEWGHLMYSLVPFEQPFK